MNHYEYRLFEYEGDWVCAFPDLPGCSGIGDTPEAALADGEIAKSLWLEDYFDENGLYPVAKNRYSKGYNGKILLRTSKSMHRDLVLMAEDENVTLNALCTQLLAEGLGRKQAAQTVHFNITVPAQNSCEAADNESWKASKPAQNTRKLILYMTNIA